ncbi:MAG: CCA tRNA nucleotidyltransferase [Eubacterium sp.]|nr:CCA tRNA nucleotidyltransferase [Eubacterium sp.]
MTISENAKAVISALENAGYEAFAVGGCVRDYIMKRPCDDIDITTSAKPDELEKVLKDNNIKFIETGLKHGTVTAVFNGDTFEITTYRTDGDYKDSRHPENVEFVTDIKEDLSRRDFTVNAMAYNDSVGIVDLFGGQADIENKIIRAVGNADKRFKEDALRIMRAIRFASVLSFDIEPDTKKAIFENKELLKNVSAERIFTELSKLLMGDNVFNVLVEYREIIAVVIPELEPIFNIDQNTSWHIYNVWEHTCNAVDQAPRDLAIRLTMLLHDIGKAFAKTTDENGTDHFKGHQKISAQYAETALKRLKVSNEIYDRVMFLVPIHDMHIGTDRKKIKKWLSKVGESSLRDLIEVKRADKLAQNPEKTQQELINLDITKSELDSVIAEGEPFTVKDLAVNGNDMMSLGLQGKQIGSALNLLLDKVINNELPNIKENLISYIKKQQID